MKYMVTSLQQKIPLILMHMKWVKETMPLYYNILIGDPSSSIYRWYLYWASYMGVFSSS